MLTTYKNTYKNYRLFVRKGKESKKILVTAKSYSDAIKRAEGQYPDIDFNNGLLSIQSIV